MFERGNACKVALGYNIRRSKFGEWDVREYQSSGVCGSGDVLGLRARLARTSA
jgi:hypothetical protein